jgi:DNA modification methylase
MLDCSDRGGIVLDCFGGSGVTVIAAERTGRKALCLSKIRFPLRRRGRLRYAP